jgi:hypothetical protein
MKRKRDDINLLAVELGLGLYFSLDFAQGREKIFYVCVRRSAEYRIFICCCFSYSLFPWKVVGITYLGGIYQPSQCEGCSLMILMLKKIL